ncbi:MvaI/BcnI family restriction endonuclease [Massilia sp. R2A-15]|uniref:MvaI/BcnI family restriction endonuclease n=1 Tax=Massilia sp. R2A-15 TaxID=3064278 RepID=UPI002735FC9A|nr:MvaI/BcnI family restriction endonuclease [Massilia sp. R2A-15]WLI87846.1 MvaI/BcnI family restriction endonuclease [Massilia sp. R2A-15]
MNTFPSGFEHAPRSVAELSSLLASVGADLALLKVLPKNANDKNQIYLAADFGVLYDLFDLTLAERGESASETKARSEPGSRISEAVFNSFAWLRRDGTLVPAKRLKAIIYSQYPEARLSGLHTVDNTMPQALSVAYTKLHPEAKRLLVLARLPRGKCIGIVCLDFSPAFELELAALPGFERARACKRLTAEQGNSSKLEARLAAVLGRSVRGCRLDTYGRSLPFSGTQVCGYTLEHELGINPNSDSDGDLYGIELKTHTQIKVTLFTPEPDGGFYAKDFAGFMKKYGYRDSDGDLRLTGIHRAGVTCAKSGLTLQVREFRGEGGERRAYPYDPATPLTAKFDAVDVVLAGPDGEVAASWSLERLMNCWGAKHNEVVYIAASRVRNPDSAEFDAGYEHLVRFETTVIWCRNTTAERLLKAISDGVIFLDPAPKLHATDPSKNKRRAQWRVNDITKAASALYSVVEFRTVAPVAS